MTQTIYISIIILLITIILSLLGKIREIRKEHHLKLANLYNTLSELEHKEKKNNGKMTLENNLNETISEARKQLNTDIFDLQMSLFKKITDN